jgi:hypothetical protein
MLRHGKACIDALCLHHVNNMDFPCHCNFYDLAGLFLPISVTFNGESGGGPEPFEGCLPLCEMFGK